jgi:hypothetical protein
MGKRKRGSGESGKRRIVYWALAALTVTALGAAELLWRGRSPSPTVPAVGSGSVAVGAGPVVARKETRPTLDPALFVGKVRLTHQIAREIPDVLDQLYCYCECDKHAGHKSLLSCYTDGHAAT